MRKSENENSRSENHVSRRDEKAHKQLQSLKLSNDQPEEYRRLSREIRQHFIADYESHKNRRLMETVVARRSLKQCKRSMAQTPIVGG